MLVYFMVFWNILRPFGIFYTYLVMLWSFGIFLPVLVYCAKKNLATLPCTCTLTQCALCDLLREMKSPKKAFKNIYKKTKHFYGFQGFLKKENKTSIPGPIEPVQRRGVFQAAKVELHGADGGAAAG
jgi:hypothetical protein